MFERMRTGLHPTRPIEIQPVPSRSIDELDIMEKQLDASQDIGAASVLILRANKHRTAAFFTNPSDSDIYVQLGSDAAASTGIYLKAGGGAFEINKTNLFKGDIYAIAGAATKRICALEIETRYAY